MWNTGLDEAQTAIKIAGRNINNLRYTDAAAAAVAKSLQLCPTLCNPIDGSLPGPAVPGILQARILEWVAISSSNAWKWKVKSEVTQSCPTLSDPMDCSLPGSSNHGIFPGKVLEWGAIAFSERLEPPKALKCFHTATCIWKVVRYAVILFAYSTMENFTGTYIELRTHTSL